MMYELVLFIPGGVSLTRTKEILEKLDDLDIEVDYGSLDFQDNGLFIDAGFSSDIDNIEETINSIGDIEIDWDSMADWDCWPEEECDE